MRLLTAAGIISDKVDGDERSWINTRFGKQTVEKAIRELGDDDIRDYTAVRVSDEILINLMIAACGIDYAEASNSMETAEIQGVPIPFAKAPLLLRMKQTHREKDAADRVFPHRKIAESCNPSE